VGSSHINKNELTTNYENLAYDMRISRDIIFSVINDFDLFVIKDDKFSSMSVGEKLKERGITSENARKSVQARWDKKNTNISENDTSVLKNNTSALLSYNDRNTIYKDINKNIELVGEEFSPTSSLDKSISGTIERRKRKDPLKEMFLDD